MTTVSVLYLAIVPFFSLVRYLWEWGRLVFTSIEVTHRTLLVGETVPLIECFCYYFAIPRTGGDDDRRHSLLLFAVAGHGLRRPTLTICPCFFFFLWWLLLRCFPIGFPFLTIIALHFQSIKIITQSLVTADSHHSVLRWLVWKLIFRVLSSDWFSVFDCCDTKMLFLFKMVRQTKHESAIDTGRCKRKMGMIYKQFAHSAAIRW